jgi:uncharacterized membrane protein
VLRVYLDIDRPPRLLYLNACDSREIAKQLAVQIPIVIGTTASISNRVARASAGLFYDRLLAGTTVQKAFEAGRATIALNNSSSCSELFSRADVDPSEMRLYQTPHIVARFVDSRFESDRFGYFEIEVGLKGCPADTTQVVFFTNDWNLVKEEDLDDKEDEYEIAAQLCRVVRATPVRGAIWSEWSEDINGDYLVCATGVTASGRIFAVSTMLCDALESHSVSNGSGRPSHSLSPAAARAISSLRQMDGSEAPSLADDPSPRNIRSSSVPRPRVGNQVRIRTRKKGPKGARKLGRPVKR